MHTIVSLVLFLFKNCVYFPGERKEKKKVEKEDKNEKEREKKEEKKNEEKRK